MKKFGSLLTIYEFVPTYGPLASHWLVAYHWKKEIFIVELVSGLIFCTFRLLVNRKILRQCGAEIAKNSFGAAEFKLLRV